MKVAVLASGNGSNFEAIAKAFEDQQIQGELTLVFSDKKDAYVLERAKKYQIPRFSFMPKDFASKKQYEEALRDLLLANQIDFVVLAGYMRIIGKDLLESFPNKILNIHPSLLPSFPGLHGIKDAYNYGVKITGITIHFVDAGVDTGPIVAQAAVAITEEDTLESLEEKIHQLEHHWYPKVIAEITQKGVH